MTYTIYHNTEFTVNQKKWLNHYQALCNKGKLRASTRKEAKKLFDYVEGHHIIPRCIGGTDEKENIVFLTGREHFIAHILLTKIFPHTKKLLFACHWLMYNKRDNTRLNGKSYESLKREISKYRKSQNKHNNEGIKRRVEKITGRTKENDSGVAKMAEKQRGKTKENNEGTKRMSEALTGRTKENNPGVAKMAATLTGRNQYNNEGVARMAAKQRGRTKENCESVKRQSEKMKGRTKESHPGVAAQAAALSARNKHNCPIVAARAKKLQKIPDDIKIQIYLRKTNGAKLKEIYNWIINEIGINIGLSTISGIYNNIKRKIQSSEIILPTD